MANFRDIFGPPIDDKSIKTIKRAKLYISALYKAVEKEHGEETAIKLFAPYGTPPSNHNLTVRKDAQLIWRYYSMPKPNVLALARELAGKGSKNGDRVGALRKQIQRALKNQDARDYADRLSIEINDAPLLPNSKYLSPDDLWKLQEGKYSNPHHDSFPVHVVSKVTFDDE
jgi:hypothetical protein